MSPLNTIESSKQRRVAYSLAAGATVALVGTDADAQIVWSGPQDISINQFSSLLLDIEGNIGYGVTYDVNLKNYVFGGGNYQGLSVTYFPGRAIGFQGTFPYISVLSPGDAIDDTTTTSAGVTSGSLAFGANNPSAQFNDVDGVYIGVRFPINTYKHFGWIRVSIDNAAGTFIVHDWAYNSSKKQVLDENGMPIIGTNGSPILEGLPIRAGQVAGDYNGDGLVDAADYTVYRDTLGSTTDLRADGDADGVISEMGSEAEDDGDYVVWAQDYGFSAFAPSVPPAPEPAATTSIPEPATLGLLACGAAGLGLLRLSRRSDSNHSESDAR